MNNLTIVILAAGLGTRMKSRKAKVLHEAGGLPLVEHVVRSASALTEPSGIVVVTGHQADRVEAALGGRGVRFVRQTEQLGTGHALRVCQDAVPSREGLLMTLYGDCPLLSASTLERLLERHAASGAAATVITTELDDPTGYGRAILDENGCIAAIVEEKVATPEQKRVRLINSGIYCFDAAALWRHLPSIEPNPVSREYYLTDIVEVFRANGLATASFLHEDADELLGINTRVELARVDGIFRERKCRELMLAGVTIAQPETVRIDADCRIGMDTLVEPHAQILGRTEIGEDCRIGAGSVLQDCVVEPGVDISPYTVASQSRIESGATLGPFARLRPNTHVEADAHIGNFVELKNTRLGRGSKAGHLAYLGDSNIGQDCNIGAGTITCNYDGKRKHKTSIGDGAFVGSNSTLVAPVSIGEGAYVGAGSAVTNDVPPDALALGRARQVNKDEWAKRRRAATSASAPPDGR